MKKDPIDVADIDFTKLSKAAIFTIISFVSADMDEACIIAEITKGIAMEITFADKNSMKEERRNLIGYTLNYVVWFADVLLHCDDEGRKILVDSFLECADIIGNDNTEHLLTWLIQEQELYGKKDEFWKIWELLKPRMIELSNEKTARAIADETGVEICTFYSVQNVTEADFSAGESYVSLMLKNVATLERGLN